MNGRNPTRNEKRDAAATVVSYDVLVASDKESDGTRKVIEHVPMASNTLFRLVAIDR